jgi:hypothetical protein
VVLEVASPTTAGELAAGVAQAAAELSGSNFRLPAIFSLLKGRRADLRTE